MTAPEPGSNKLTAAKALFIGFFAAALGWAGVLIAAVAVATEQTWSDGRPEGDRARERRAGWMATQRSWVAADHSRRVAQAKSRQDWLDEGADPGREPKRPSAKSRLGAALRRVFLNVLLAALDFARHFRDGWAEAQRVRRAGGSFDEIRDSRPGNDVDDEAGHEDAEAVDEAGPQDQSEQDEEQQATGTTDQDSQDETQDETEGGPTQEPDAPDTTQVPPQDTEGEPMTAPTESNATVLAAKLTEIDTTVGEVSADVDELGAITTELRSKVQRAADLAHSAGMPTDAVVAVDAVQHAAAAVDARLEDFSTSAAEASVQLQAAAEGLQPVKNAEDRLHAAGADGRVFDTAAA